MADLSSQETKSYRDPLGEAGFTSLIEPAKKDATDQDAESALQEPGIDQDPESALKESAADQDAESAPKESTADQDVESNAESASESDLKSAPESDSWSATDLDLESDQDPEPGDEADSKLATEPDYPSIDDCYRGFYQEFWPESDEGKHFIAGIEGIIGSTVANQAADNGRCLMGLDGSVVSCLKGVDVSELNDLERSGWTIECRMALSLYHSKEKCFSGEVAWMAYNATAADERLAIEEFIKGISARIAHGAHPVLALDQAQFERVLQSQGRWYMTKDIPLGRLPTGTIVHRRKRGLSDWLITAALRYRVGCTVVTWGFFLAVAAVIYLCFFR